MPEEWKRINKILVWIIAISTIAYFVLLPVSFTRPTPQTISPQEIKVPEQPLLFGPKSTETLPLIKPESTETLPLIPKSELTPTSSE